MRPPFRRAEATAYVLAFATTPAEPVVGQPFTMAISVCARIAGAPIPPPTVDAWMPEHRHGMNYRTRVTPDGSARFHVSGLLFHMPGRWEVLFGFSSPAGTTDRATATIELE